MGLLGFCSLLGIHMKKILLALFNFTLLAMSTQLAAMDSSNTSAATTQDSLDLCAEEIQLMREELIEKNQTIRELLYQRNHLLPGDERIKLLDLKRGLLTAYTNKLYRAIKAINSPEAVVYLAAQCASDDSDDMPFNEDENGF